jgi:hypothetical protein
LLGLQKQRHVLQTKELLWIVAGLTHAKITLADFLTTYRAPHLMFLPTVQTPLSAVSITMMEMALRAQLVHLKATVAQQLRQLILNVF